MSSSVLPTSTREAPRETKMTHRMPEYEHLLEPIPGEFAAGESLRYDPVYDRITHARTQEAALSQGVWQRDTQQANWALVEELCQDALATRSKDLQLAIWLTEAWLHRYKLPGFAGGCRLIAALHDRYAVELLPSPEQTAETPVALPLAEDAAIEHRLNMIQWMNEKLSIELKLLPLTFPPPASDLTPCSLADVENALHQQQAKTRSGTQDKTPYDAEMVRGLQLTSPELVTRLWTELLWASDAVRVLEETLDRVYGPADGGLLRIREVLRQMRLAVEPAVIPPKPEEAMAEESTAMEDRMDGVGMSEIGTDGSEPARSALNIDERAESTPAEEAGMPIVGPGGFQTREQAYETLEAIANFLATIEPHSPVPYLLRRAVAWGGMSLMELLPELLQDQAALKDVGHLLRMTADGSGVNLK